MTDRGETRAETGAAARRRGLAAENLAAFFLRLKGYRILARGFAIGRGSGAGEIDIIARRGKILAFVEVKARPDAAEAAAAISARKRQRLIRGAEAFLKSRPDLSALDLRFDAFFVLPRRLPRHVPDAFRPESGPNSAL